jgi:uncharacterized protein
MGMIGRGWGAVLALACLMGVARAQEGPQPELPTVTITVQGHGGPAHRFIVERTRTGEEQELGLMFRRSLAADRGMLFDFGLPPAAHPMWMKNTLIPLDMLFVAADGHIVHIAEETVPESLAFIQADAPVRAVVELQGGITRRLDIRVDDTVSGAWRE